MSDRQKLIEVMARAIEPHMPAQVKYWQEGGMMRAKLIGPYDPEYVSPLPAATAALAALEAAGVRLVPMEATGEMIQMAESLHTIDELTTDEYRRAYKAMIAFSPYAPEGTTSPEPGE